VFILMVLSDMLLQHVNSFLVSSAPSDGASYTVKCWISVQIVEPICEILYCIGLTTVKPVSAMTTEDLLRALEIEDHTDAKR
jgi:hypothetical protein